MVHEKKDVLASVITFLIIILLIVPQLPVGLFEGQTEQTGNTIPYFPGDAAEMEPEEYRPPFQGMPIRGPSSRNTTAPGQGEDDDNDSLPDEWEVEHHLDPLNASGNNGPDGDPDLDGLTNIMEYRLGADPHLIDTDSDGVPDAEDVDPARDVMIRLEVNAISALDPVDESGIGSEADLYIRVHVHEGNPWGRYAEGPYDWKANEDSFRVDDDQNKDYFQPGKDDDIFRGVWLHSTPGVSAEGGRLRRALSANRDNMMWPNGTFGVPRPVFNIDIEDRNGETYFLNIELWDADTDMSLDDQMDINGIGERAPNLMDLGGQEYDYPDNPLEFSNNHRTVVLRYRLDRERNDMLETHNCDSRISNISINRFRVIMNGDGSGDGEEKSLHEDDGELDMTISRGQDLPVPAKISLMHEFSPIYIYTREERLLPIPKVAYYDREGDGRIDEVYHNQHQLYGGGEISLAEVIGNTADLPIRTYAHVFLSTDDKVIIQYVMYYAADYSAESVDHWGDREMIQLAFLLNDVLTLNPSELRPWGVAYGAHYGDTFRTDAWARYEHELSWFEGVRVYACHHWGNHPLVFVSQGSHACHFSDENWYSDNTGVHGRVLSANWSDRWERYLTPDNNVSLYDLRLFMHSYHPMRGGDGIPLHRDETVEINGDHENFVSELNYPGNKYGRKKGGSIQNRRYMWFDPLYWMMYPSTHFFTQ